MSATNDHQALLDLWKEEVKATHKAASYIPTIQRLVSFMDNNELTLATLKLHHLEKFIVQNYHQINKGSAHLAIRQWLDFAIAQELSSTNVAFNLRNAAEIVNNPTPKPTRKPYNSKSSRAEALIAGLTSQVTSLTTELRDGLKSVDERLSRFKPAASTIPAAPPAPKPVTAPSIYDIALSKMKTEGERVKAKIVFKEFSATVAPEKATPADIEQFFLKYNTAAKFGDLKDAYDIMLGLFQVTNNNPMKNFGKQEFYRVIDSRG